MVTVLFLNIFVVLAAYLARYSEFKFGLKISFFIIFIFLAIRYNFGNDYMSYYEGFISLNSYSSVNYFDPTIPFEAGWIFLCRLFQPLGFFSMVIFLALFNCVVYYLFIVRYVPVQYYWIAVFFYVFTPGFMLVQASAMRQSVAIALFLISVRYIYRKDLVRFLACIGIAYLFHRSAIFLAPAYLLGLLKWKINKTWGIILFAIFLLLFTVGKLFLPSIQLITNDYFQKYEGYLGAGSEMNSGIGVVFMSIVLVFILLYSRFQRREYDILFKLSIFSFMFIPLGLLILMISRIGMYFAPATIVVYPVIMANIKDATIKRAFTSLLLAFTLYTFVMFFSTGTYKVAFAEYQTIFSAPPITN